MKLSVNILLNGQPTNLAAKLHATYQADANAQVVTSSPTEYRSGSIDWVTGTTKIFYDGPGSDFPMPQNIWGVTITPNITQTSTGQDLVFNVNYITVPADTPTPTPTPTPQSAPTPHGTMAIKIVKDGNPQSGIGIKLHSKHPDGTVSASTSRDIPETGISYSVPVGEYTLYYDGGAPIPPGYDAMLTPKTQTVTENKETIWTLYISKPILFGINPPTYSSGIYLALGAIVIGFLIKKSKATNQTKSIEVQQ